MSLAAAAVNSGAPGAPEGTAGVSTSTRSGRCFIGERVDATTHQECYHAPRSEEEAGGPMDRPRGRCVVRRTTKIPAGQDGYCSWAT